MSGERQAVTVDRSLALLAAMGNGAMTFSQLGQRVSCTDAILSRLLKGLLAAELIRGGGGQAYALSARARDFARCIVGDADSLGQMRDALRQISELTGTGCAWFAMEEGGVRCLLRQQLSEGVGYIDEGRMRTELLGHGAMVAACALSPRLEAQHGPALRDYLSLGKRAWQQRLGAIRRQGYDLSHGQEGVPGQGQGRLETLARLSIPHQDAGGQVFVLTATGHGLTAARVFPISKVHALLAISQQLFILQQAVVNP